MSLEVARSIEYLDLHINSRLPRFILRFPRFIRRLPRFILRLPRFILRFPRFILRLSGFVLRLSGFVLRLSGFVLRIYSRLSTCVGGGTRTFVIRLGPHGRPHFRSTDAGNSRII